MVGNYSLKEWMVITKRMSPKCKLQTEDIKQVQEFKYPGTVLTETGTYSTGTDPKTYCNGQRCFPKAKQGIKRHENFVRNKTKVY